MDRHQNVLRIILGAYSTPHKKDVQFCPKCGSTNIKVSTLIPFGDPIKQTGLLGWDCLDCKYTGKDFFIVSEDEYKKIVKEKFHKKI